MCTRKELISKIKRMLDSPPIEKSDASVPRNSRMFQERKFLRKGSAHGDWLKVRVNHYIAKYNTPSQDVLYSTAWNSSQYSTRRQTSSLRVQRNTIFKTLSASTLESDRC
jgi:hypothetical protein